MTKRPESFATTQMEPEDSSCSPQPSRDFGKFNAPSPETPAPASTGSSAVGSTFISVRAEDGLSSVEVPYNAEREARRIANLRANRRGSADTPTNNCP